jgi:hypothetical protein
MAERYKQLLRALEFIFFYVAVAFAVFAGLAR